MTCLMANLTRSPPRSCAILLHAGTAMLRHKLLRGSWFASRLHGGAPPFRAARGSRLFVAASARAHPLPRAGTSAICHALLAPMEVCESNRVACCTAATPVRAVCLKTSRHFSPNPPRSHPFCKRTSCKKTDTRCLRLPAAGRELVSLCMQDFRRRWCASHDRFCWRQHTLAPISVRRAFLPRSG